MSYHNISVCKGPNCKAWNSDRFVRELREIGNNTGCDGINVRRVNCMDACHGGVSVRVNSTRKVIKIKYKSIYGNIEYSLLILFS